MRTPTPGTASAHTPASNRATTAPMPSSAENPNRCPSAPKVNNRPSGPRRRAARSGGIADVCTCRVFVFPHDFRIRLVETEHPLQGRNGPARERTVRSCPSATRSVRNTRLPTIEDRNNPLPPEPATRPSACIGDGLQHTASRHTPSRFGPSHLRPVVRASGAACDAHRHDKTRDDQTAAAPTRTAVGARTRNEREQHDVALGRAGASGDTELRGGRGRPVNDR